MHGKIKSGQGSLIGNSGEHHVIAELLQQGVIAAMTPRNSPSFDIFAAKGKRTVRIRVKTKSEQYDHFQWNIKKDGKIFRQISRDNDFVVMVNLKTKLKRPDFFIVPTYIINKWLTVGFNRWLKTPGKNKRPHSSTNMQRHLSYKDFQDTLDEQYLDNWKSLWQRR